MPAAPLHRFVIVSRPTGADWWVYFLGSAKAPPALRSAPGVDRLDLAEGGGGRVLWPTPPSAHTVPARYQPPREGARGRITVEPAALGWLNGCPDNRLYLPGLPACDVLQLTDLANRVSYCFRPGPDLPVGPVTPLVASTSPLVRGFFHQVRRTSLPDPLDRERVADYELVGESVADDRPDGWFNPVVTLVELDGDGLAGLLGMPAAGSEPQTPAAPTAAVTETPQAVFARLAAPAAVLHVEPGWDETWTGRHWFQRAMFARRRGVPASAVERVLWGPNPRGAAPWVPFFALDGLGGGFLLGAYGTGRPRADWLPPAGARPNRMWFADYWGALWCPDEVEAKAQGTNPESRPPVDERPVIPPPFAPRPWQPATRRVPCEASDVGALLASAAPLLVAAGGPTGADAVLTWLGQVLAAESPARAVDSHHGYYRLPAGPPNHRRDVLLDAAGFLQAFAENFLVPSSPVRVVLPQPDGTADPADEWLVDLTGSLQDGGRELLTRWFRATAADDRSSAVEVPFGYGWWNDWYALLYTAAWDVRVTFRAAAGFVLGVSKLGHGQLGRGPKAYTQDPFAHFRF